MWQRVRLVMRVLHSCRCAASSGGGGGKEFKKRLVQLYFFVLLLEAADVKYVSSACNTMK